MDDGLGFSRLPCFVHGDDLAEAASACMWDHAALFTVLVQERVCPLLTAQFIGLGELSALLITVQFIHLVQGVVLWFKLVRQDYPQLVMGPRCKARMPSCKGTL
jgi:hypothetical protein